MKKSAAIFIVVILSVIVIFPVAAVVLYESRYNYYIFTQKRIAEMEDIFEIDFSNIKLERYRVGTYRASLDFSGIEDYEDFVEKRVNGDTAYIFKDNTTFDYLKNTQSEIGSVEAELMRKPCCEAMYYITSCDGMDYRICFYEENNGSYSAVASYSTWGVCY